MNVRANEASIDASVSATKAAGRSLNSKKHIVDILIEERAPHLAAGPLWPIAGPILRGLLGYKKARSMADAIAPLPGYSALNYVSKLLRLNTKAQGLENIPHLGRCVIIANHPTGIADGVALYDALRDLRPDLCFFANADALRVSHGLSDVVIPVEWPPEKRTLQSSKATVRHAKAAMECERAVVIFAAGALSRRVKGELRDPDWEHSAVALARKYSAPIVPAHVTGPFPYLFHLFDRFSDELRDVTLFHELLNKANGDYAPCFNSFHVDINQQELFRDPYALRVSPFLCRRRYAL
ncbi:MAG: 1-acyl-sn-glycerol-3-phosphate acyltransferase [Pseudomonadota bacterium]